MFLISFASLANFAANGFLVVAPLCCVSVAGFVCIALLRVALILSTRPFFVRQDFQAGGPPSGEDGVDEFLRQSFRSHVLCQ